MPVCCWFCPLHSIVATAGYGLWDKQYPHAVPSARNLETRCCIAWHFPSETPIRTDIVNAQNVGLICPRNVYREWWISNIRQYHGLWSDYQWWQRYVSIHLLTLPQTFQRGLHQLAGCSNDTLLQECGYWTSLSGYATLHLATQAGEYSHSFRTITATTSALTSGHLTSHTVTKLFTKSKLNWRQGLRQRSLV